MNDRRTKNILFVGNDKLPRKAFGGAKGTVREKENTDGRGQRAAALAPDSTYRVQRGLYLQELQQGLPFSSVGLLALPFPQEAKTMVHHGPLSPETDEAKNNNLSGLCS